MTTPAPAPAKKRKLAQLTKKERSAYSQLVEDGHEAVNQLVHRHLPAQILALQALLEEAQSINPSTTNESNNESNNMTDVDINKSSSTTTSANQTNVTQPLKNDWFNDPWLVQSDNETYLSTRPFNNQSPDQPVLVNKSYAWRPKRRAAYVSFRPDLPIIDQLHKSLHPIIRRLVDMFSVMSLSVKLILPDVGETSSQAVDVPIEAYTAIQLMLRFIRPQLTTHILYHSHRAKLQAKTVKYPSNQDYSESISQWDEREWSRTINLIRETRSRCIAAYDSLKKNEEKLREARVKEHHHSMM